MGKRQQITEDIRSRIVALANHSSKTHREIATIFKICHTTVTRIINLERNTGSVVARKRSGRPKATSQRTDSLIRREVIKDPFISAANIKRNLVPLCNNVTLRTIQTRLANKFNMPARRPAKKPMITTKMRKSRIEFCKSHRHWSIDDWKSVMFSDESTFLQHNCLPSVVRRLPGISPLNPRYTQKTIKHSPGVMAWGCFSYRGRGALTFLNKSQKMNSETYVAILEDKLRNFMTSHHCTIFQQDKAPCHTAKRSMEWFRTNGIQVLSWPGNSPDLNPIENLWQQVKRKISYSKCISFETLKHEVTRVWCLETTPEQCQTLVESMPRRIKAVLDNNGFPTKY